MVKAVARKQRMQEQLMADVISLHKGIFEVLRAGGPHVAQIPSITI